MAIVEPFPVLAAVRYPTLAMELSDGPLMSDDRMRKPSDRQ